MNHIFTGYHTTSAAGNSPSTFLPGTRIEVVRHISPPKPPVYALFDFDGTVSLVREGWQGVMIPMMVKLIAETGTDESEAGLTALVTDIVERLTGKQTIYQMIALAEEIEKRGGKPRDPLYYKGVFNDRLLDRIHDRREGLRSGRIDPEDCLVPNAVQALELLRERGATICLASGTDEPYVREEAALLGIDWYFGEHIYGASADYKTSSKEQVIGRMLAVNGLAGSSLLGFGDGYVEIANVKTVGGTAVGVASDERNRSGKVDEWKRRRLIGVGADAIIPDFRDSRALFDLILPEG